MMRPRIRKQLFSLLGGLVLSTCSIVTNPALGDVSLHIDPSVSHQTMNGWEVSGRMWQFDKAADSFNDEWEAHAAEILDTLVNELGINRFRLEALSGIENPSDYWTPFVNGDIGYEQMREHFYEKVNDNNDAYNADINGFNFGYIDYIVEKMLLPIKERVESNNEQLYINLTYVDFKWTDLRGDIEHATDPDEYAEFILVIFNHLKQKYGLVPDALELILEADNTLHWSGANIGKGLLAAKLLLNENGFYPEFIAPSTATAWRTREFFDGLQGVPGAADALDELSYHRYDSSVSATSLVTIAGLAETWSLRTSMLEHVGADYRELMDDLLLANASSWQQYGIATNLLDDPGGYYIKFDNSVDGAPHIFFDKRAIAFSIVFPFIRRDAIRIDTQSADQRLKAASFMNIDDTMVTLIATDAASDVSIAGLKSGSYTIHHVDSTGELSETQDLLVTSGEVAEISVLPGLTSIVDIEAGLANARNAPSTDPTEATDDADLSDSRTSDSSSGALSIFFVCSLMPVFLVNIYQRRKVSNDRQGETTASIKPRQV